MNIFIGKLNYQTDSSTLRAAFEEFGEVSSCKVITDKFSGRSRGFGFVEMENSEEAQTAMEELNDSFLDGNTIVVNEAKERADRRQSKNYNSNW